MVVKIKEYICPACYHYIKGETDSCPECGGKIRPKLDLILKSKLKKIAWKAFSDYIKVRDCISTTGASSCGICYTCGERLEISKLQAGHLKTGRTNDILFDEENVRIQCLRCNVCKNGRQGIFTLNRLDDLIRSGLSCEDAMSKLYKYILSSPEKVSISNEDLCNLIRIYKIKRYKLLEELDDRSSD